MTNRTRLQRSLGGIIAGVALLWIVGVLLLVAMLAVSPPYSGISEGWRLQPATLIAPLRTYLFRNAVINTGWLILTVTPLSLGLGWLWARLGLPTVMANRVLLLLPLCLPGAIAGLLWQGYLTPLLILAQAELALLATGLVMLWRTVPAIAWLLAFNPRMWLLALALPALLILSDAGLVLMLTGGAPFNAAHTWPSWLLQQLWTNRAWGHAASMAGGLALVIVLVLLGSITFAQRTFATSENTENTLLRQRKPLPLASTASILLAIAWALGPFALPFWRGLLAAQWASVANYHLLGALLFWLGCIALVTLATTRLVWLWQSHRPRRLHAGLAIGAIALAPLWLVAIANLRESWPLVAFLTLPLLLILTVTTLQLALPHLRTHVNFTSLALTALLLAHTFPVELVLQWPLHATRLSPPTLAFVMRLGSAAHLPTAQAAGLGLHLLLAWVTAFLLMKAASMLVNQRPMS